MSIVVMRYRYLDNTNLHVGTYDFPLKEEDFGDTVMPEPDMGNIVWVGGASGVLFDDAARESGQLRAMETDDGYLRV